MPAPCRSVSWKEVLLAKAPLAGRRLSLFSVCCVLLVLRSKGGVWVWIEESRKVFGLSYLLARCAKIKRRRRLPHNFPSEIPLVVSVLLRGVAMGPSTQAHLSYQSGVVSRKVSASPSLPRYDGQGASMSAARVAPKIVSSLFCVCFFPFAFCCSPDYFSCLRRYGWSLAPRRANNPPHALSVHLF